MNEKWIKFAKSEGFCCLWAFLEANRAVHTSKLVALAKEAGFTITARALRHQRRAYRRKQIECLKLGTEKCLKEKIRLARTIP